MQAEKIRVLMTGAGAPGAAGIIQCLLKENTIDLTVADADENAVGHYLHENFVCIPKADNPQFIKEVLATCKKRNIQFILPLVTKELLPLSKSKKLFEKEGIQILVSSEKAITIANNKCSSYQYLSEKGIAVPRHFVIHTKEEFIHAAFELGHPHTNFCFKPSVSNGSRGVRIVSDSIDESDQLFNHKPYNLYCSYSHALSILSSKPFPELLLCEYLPGTEYSVDCLADHGKAKLIVPRSRNKMINGISVAGEFVNDEQIIDYCRRIIEVLSLHGNIGIQVKQSESGEALLIEINPRVQGTIVAALGAGINLPLLAIKQEAGMNFKPDELKVKWGTRFSRYWTEVFY